MKTTEEQKILNLLNKSGFIRARDLERHGISRTAILRLLKSGVVTRPARGLYVAMESTAGENQNLAETVKLVPKAVICLLSALRFHDLTTQEPFETWIALPSKAWYPNVTSAAVRVVRMSGESLRYGIESHVIGGVKVRVFSPAKTVADCFKFRSLVGLDVAIEALRDRWREKKATMDEIHKAAKVCRMSNVMRPYLESIV